MGVPRFYRWISERYPLINQVYGNGQKPEFDCLYLDMNGIVHKCTHDNNATFDLSETEVFQKIGTYIDHLFSLAEPQKLLYLAVDGVAPRAKMNQQRQRRFKSDRERKEARQALIDQGLPVPANSFDSNCITPGTEFMDRLSDHLEYFVRSKIATDEKWKSIDVILSSSQVVGEGEHKIMEYLRNQRMQPDYNPNLRHCLYGLDADLIILSLLSHEHHIALLREEVVFGKPKETVKVMLRPQEFQLLHISVLREYLELDFRSLKLKFAFDLDRIIDDIIFLCFFIGNDFLPNLPTISIIGGGLDKLFNLYRGLLPEFDDYLTHWGTVSLKRLEIIFKQHATHEASIFRSMAEEAKKLKERLAELQGVDSLISSKPIHDPVEKLSSQLMSIPLLNRPAPIQESTTTKNHLAFIKSDFNDPVNTDMHSDPNSTSMDNIDQDNLLSANLTDKDDTDSEKSSLDSIHDLQDDFKEISKYLHHANTEDEDSEALLFTDDLNPSNYYKKKFPHFYKSPEPTTTLINNLCHDYIEGLLWCFHYYYNGVVSWRWFYEHEHAPLASSLSDIANFTFSFDYGKPFTPYQQLMCVLPPGSAQFVPEPYRSLMLDENSAIIDFFPKTFLIDMDGKHASWEGTALIPKIDEQRFLQAFNTIDESLLTPYELKRSKNQLHPNILKYDTSEKQFFELPFANAIIYPKLTDLPVSIKPYTLPIIPEFPAFLTEKQIEIVKSLDKYEDSFITKLDYVRQGRYIPTLLPKVTIPLPSFPTLHSISKIEGQLRKCKIQVFSSKSRLSSLVLSSDTIDRLGAEPLEELLRRTPLNSIVYYNYPYLSYGLLTGITDGRTLYYYDNETVEPNVTVRVFSKPLDSKLIRTYYKSKKNLVQLAHQNMGIDIDENKAVLAYIRPFIGMKSFSDGSVRMRFSLSYIPALIHLTIPIKEAVKGIDFYKRKCAIIQHPPKFLTKPASTKEELYKIGSKVVSLEKDTFGSVGVITKVDFSKNNVVVILDNYAKRNMEDINDILDKYSMTFVPITKAAKQLGLSSSLVSNIISSLVISKAKIEIGLLFKSPNSSHFISDFILCTNPWSGYYIENIETLSNAEEVLNLQHKRWSISQLGIAIISDYKNKFPVLFEKLDNVPPMKRGSIQFSDIASKMNIPESKLIQDIQDFISNLSYDEYIRRLNISDIKHAKDLKVKSLRAGPATSECLPYIACEYIERRAVQLEEDERKAFEEQKQNSKQGIVIYQNGLKTRTKKQISLSKLYSTNVTIPWSPSFQFQHFSATDEQNVMVGDAVVCLDKDSSVPLGLPGIVVSIHPVDRSVEVIFDYNFLCGTNLVNKCQTNRGFILSMDSILNLSRYENTLQGIPTSRDVINVESTTTVTNKTVVKQSNKQNKGLVKSALLEDFPYDNYPRQKNIISAIPVPRLFEQPTFLQTDVSFKPMPMPESFRVEIKEAQMKKTPEKADSGNANVSTSVSTDILPTNLSETDKSKFISKQQELSASLRSLQSRFTKPSMTIPLSKDGPEFKPALVNLAEHHTENRSQGFYPMNYQQISSESPNAPYPDYQYTLHPHQPYPPYNPYDSHGQHFPPYPYMQPQHYMPFPPGSQPAYPQEINMQYPRTHPHHQHHNNDHNHSKHKHNGD